MPVFFQSTAESTFACNRSPRRLAKWLIIALVGALGATGLAFAGKSLSSKAQNASPEDLPSWINPPPFHYTPKDKPDPFRPFIEPEPAKSASAEEDKPQRPLTPLEKVQPTQLSLVGILDSAHSAHPMALVELPNGKGYILQPGTRIGRNNGRVSAITPQSVTIKEEVRTILGEKKTNEVVLTLPKASGEKDERLRLSDIR